MKKHLKVLMSIMVLCFLGYTTTSCDSFKKKSSRDDDDKRTEQTRSKDDDGSTDAEDTSTLDYVEKEVERTNDICPMDLKNGITMTSVYLEDDLMVYTYSVDESWHSIDNLRSNREQIKLNTIALLKVQEAAQPLIEALVKLNYTLKYRYEGDQSGDEFVITIDPNDACK